MNDWVEEELSELQKAGLYRSLREVDTPQAAVINLDGKEVINFCSNNYLGLASDHRLGNAVRAASFKWRSGAGSSRLVSGNLSVFQKLEKDLSRFMNAPAALYFNSGYHANTGIIPALAGKEDAVFSDRLNHASIIDGCRLSRAKVHIYEHADPAALDHALKKTSARRKLIITETLFSMDGDLAPLPQIIETARAHGAMVMLDEAHAFGLLGKNGRGALEGFGLSADSVDVVVGTLGKAAGSAGAFACARPAMIELFINRVRPFIFTTGPPPAAAVAAQEGLRIMKDEPWRRERALSLAERLRDALDGMGFDTSDCRGAIVPVVLGREERTMEACRLLLEKGIFVQGIRPPTVPAGSSRLRVSLTASHTDDHLEKLISSLKEVLK
ncbi:MAG: 8-amino-7-oxononanoate synthase [bacterium]